MPTTYIAYADLDAPYGGGSESRDIVDALTQRGLLLQGLFRAVRRDDEHTKGAYPAGREGARVAGVISRRLGRSARLTNESLFDRAVAYRVRRRHSPGGVFLASCVSPRSLGWARERGMETVFYAKNCPQYGETILREADKWNVEYDSDEVVYAQRYDQFLAEFDVVLSLARVDESKMAYPASSSEWIQLYNNVSSEVVAHAREARRTRRAPKQLHFLFMGPHILRKGAFHLLEAWSQSGEPGELCIAGLSREDIRCIRTVVGCRWPALRRVSLVERVDRNKAFSWADVVVQPTLAEGGPPRTVLEAAWAGIPVITTSVGAGPVFSSDEMLIATLGNGGLSAAITAFVSDSARAHYGEQALRAVAERNHGSLGQQVAMHIAELDARSSQAA